MGFISGTSTVTVQAKLTDAGKKKLYDSIENTASGFITQFAIGDTDANYAAIDAGASALSAGYVPEASGFRPSIRSFALYKGQYRPGIPVLLIDGAYGSDNGVTKSLSIGNMMGPVSKSLTFEVTTEWPKDDSFSETYKVVIQNPGNISEDRLNRYFTLSQLGGGRWSFQFNGFPTISEIPLLAGAYGTGNGTVVPIKIIGGTTNAYIMYNIQLVQ
jgi:hypothetical protein